MYGQLPPAVTALELASIVDRNTSVLVERLMSLTKVVGLLQEQAGAAHAALGPTQPAR